jgi:WD40 repeat protein
MKVKFTELNSGYEGESKVSRFSAKTKAKIIIAAVLVVAFITVLVLSLVGVIPMDALLIRIRVALTGEDENFPISVNTDSLVSTDIMNDGLILLTSENVILYDSKGREKYTVSHVYSKPGMSVNDENAIVFDRGGTSYMLLGKKEMLSEGEAQSKILCGYYGNDDTYAIATLGDRTTSTLSVFDKNHEVVFKWNCSKEYISSVTISDNGEYIGVCVIGAENGEIFTTMYFFGVDYKEPIATAKIRDAVPMSLEFTEKDILTLVTDIGIYSLSKENTKLNQIVSYYSSEFTCCDISNKGDYLVALAKYGSKNVFEVNAYSSEGEKLTTISVNGEVKSSYITDKYIVILADNQILVYNFKGKLISTITYKGEPLSLLPTDDFIYIESLDRIYRCFTYGDSSLTLVS